MARALQRLPTTSFSGLDYDNIMTDIINLVTDNPNYNENWDDFLSSNAGRMLIELFAYIADQLATRMDWYVNEVFLGTATQKSSVIKILKLIGYNFTLPIASQVGVRVQLTSTEWAKVSPNGFYLTTSYTAGDTGWTPFSLTASGKDGVTKTFELLDYSPTTSIYNYTTAVIINDFLVTKSFYEGKTYIETLTATTDNNQIFTLANSPVVENSVLVRLVGDTVETDLTLVNSFLDPSAQREEDDSGDTIPIPYIINVDADDVVSIEFGPTSLLSSATRRLAVGQSIRVLYRVGGGINGNITKQSIAPGTSKNVLVNKVGGGTATVTITFENPTAGTGGADGETPEHAAVYAPLSIRTVEKAVTEEDYGILLDANEDVITAKSYGGSNMPTDLYTLYGEYIKPMEVWNYVIPNNAENWTTDQNTLAPSKYNAFRFITLRLENRFNGIYNFTSGALNNESIINTSDINQGDTYVDWFGDTNYYYYQDAGDSFYDGDSLSGLSDGDSYKFVVNSYEYKITIVSGDSTNYQHVVDLINAAVTGDSLYASIAGDTGSQDIRFANYGDTGYVILDQASGDTMWPSLSAWDTFGDSLQVFGLGDTFYNWIVVDAPTALKNAILNAINGDSYIRIKVSTAGDTSQQFRNILSLVIGDSLYGDTNNSSTWRIEENINAFLQSYTNIGSGVDMSSNYKMEISADGDTYIEIDLKDGAVDPAQVRSYEIAYNINRAFFESPSYGDSGGGDTSYGDSTGLLGIATVITSGTSHYIKLTSPKSGDSSKIQIKLGDSVDISTSVFGSILAGDTGDSFTCYGKKKLTVITKSGDANFGNLIYESGTLNVTGDSQVLYLHYLSGDTDTIFIGNYFYNTYNSGDPEYRPQGRRIYNSYYTTEGDSIIDASLSDFELRFTKGDTEAMSIYVINNDWTLSEGDAATVIGDTELGDTISIIAQKYIRVDIDSKGDTTVDITDGGDSGSYSTTQIVSNINSALQTAYAAEGAPYNTATYCSIIGDSMRLKSPVVSVDSSIRLIPPASGDSALPILFAISLGGDSVLYTASGDYLVQYDSGTNMMKIKKTNDSQIPDLNFRCHFICDRRQEVGGDTNPITEDDFDYYLQDKKVIGIENVFKKTKFTTFDIKGTIHYNQLYTEGQTQTAVENALVDRYSLLDSNGNSKRTHGVDVYRSRILDLIHSITGVEYVEIEFFGKDATDTTTDETDLIDCRFDEILIISEKRYEDNVLIHGPIFDYQVVEE